MCINFEHIFYIDILGFFLRKCLQDNIGSGNDLGPLGTKPLPEPVLIKIFEAKWCY